MGSSVGLALGTLDFAIEGGMLGKFEEEIVGLELGRSVEVIDGATDGEIWGLPVLHCERFSQIHL